MHRSLAVLAILSTLTLLLAAPVGACPVCASETAEQVRAGLVDEHLGISIAAVVLPFLVLSGIVALLHFGLPAKGRNHGPRS